MKQTKIIFILFLLLNSVLMSQTIKTKSTKKTKKRKEAKITVAQTSDIPTISGYVTHTYSYCGGAVPSEEMLEEAATPKPLVGKIFHIRKGNINTTSEAVILSFTSDKDGKFSFQIPPGTYSIILDSQVNELNINNYKANKFLTVDEECLKNWWAKPYYILEVKNKNITDLHFNFHQPCFVADENPCIQYIGPMPP